MATVQVPLEKDDVKLLIQSLDHCLATCVKKAGKDTPCEDCDRARSLRDRLAKIS